MKITRLVGVVALVGVVGALPPPAAADHVREGDVRFKTTCEYSHTLADDPITFPRQPGVSHLHDFAGNRAVDADTTSYKELLGGTTTCNDPQDLAGYWAPSAFDAAGKQVIPERMTAYYRRGDKHGEIRPYPNGLRVVADAIWQCTGATGSFLRGATPAGCVANTAMEVRFPDCWDGVSRDAADHRSHMAFSAHDDAVAANVCPASHPVPVPALTVYVNYPAPPASLSSGPADTAHGDFFNGWQRARLVERIGTCLNGLVFCDSGGV